MPNSAISNYQSKVTSHLIFICILFFCANLRAQPVLQLTPVITSGLNQPIQFVNAGDETNRIFIVEKTGTIRVFDAAFGNESLFLTVSNISTDGERGLLSMAFHPNYATNGFFYVYYVNTQGNLELARYKVSDGDANVANASSKVVLKTIPHPVNANHNGGTLHFGADGFLYLSTGDGGGAGDQPNNAQTPTVLLGKMLRFNVSVDSIAPYYTIPTGNPFGNEVFALGLRNPYRWSFDRQTNDMWIGDVGQDTEEELDFLAAGTPGGANFGWHCFEGDLPYNTATTGCGDSATFIHPVRTYPSQNPSAAITGGVVYRGTTYPALQGYNISADFYSGYFYKTISNGSGGWDTTSQYIGNTGIVNFGETENGEVYVVSLTGNSVYRLGASIVLPVNLLNFSDRADNGGVQLNWQTAAEDNLKQFQIEYSLNGSSFKMAGFISAKNNSAGSSYSFLHAINYEGTIFYRLKIINVDGSSRYSDIISISLHNKELNLVAPTVINNGVININLITATYISMDLVSINGTVLLQKNIAGQTGNIKVQTGKIPTGIYMVRFTGNTKTTVQKVLIQ